MWYPRTKVAHSARADRMMRVMYRSISSVTFSSVHLHNTQQLTSYRKHGDVAPTNKLAPEWRTTPQIFQSKQIWCDSGWSLLIVTSLCITVKLAVILSACRLWWWCGGNRQEGWSHSGQYGWRELREISHTAASGGIRGWAARRWWPKRGQGLVVQL